MKPTYSAIITSLVKLLKFPYNWCRFESFHISSRIVKPMLLTPRHISIGKNVYIFNNARIEGVSKYNAKYFQPHIVILEGVTIQQNLHLTCATRITIGKNTAIAANVTITDIEHPYKDINTPIERQDINSRPVFIDQDCKIYNNVVILPGVSIGKHCIIRANSVVTKNIPDFSVAVGAPAKVIKQYNAISNQWEKIAE